MSKCTAQGGLSWDKSPAILLLVQGLRRVGASTALEAAAAAGEVAGAYWALSSARLPWDLSPLSALALAKWAVAALYAAFGLALLALYLPGQGRQEVPGERLTPLLAADSLRHAGGSAEGPRFAAAAAHTAAAGAAAKATAAEGSRALSYLGELVRDGLNIMVRSVLVQVCEPASL